MLTNHRQLVLLKPDHAVLARNVVNITAVDLDPPGGRLNARLQLVTLLQLLDSNGDVDHSRYHCVPSPLLKQCDSSHRN